MAKGFKPVRTERQLNIMKLMQTYRSVFKKEGLAALGYMEMMSILNYRLQRMEMGED